MLLIVLLALGVTVVTAPLTALSMRSQRKMADLQPKLLQLRHLHSGDPSRLATETAALFKDNGASPLAGCLPIIVQWPIFVLIFRHVRHIAARRVWFGGVDLAQTGIAALHAGPPAIAFLVVVLAVTVGVGLAQARMASPPATANPSVRRALQWAPVAFGAWALALPMAVGVYYATSSVFRLGVQWALTRRPAA